MERIMSRFYALGIIFVILFLNVPELRKDAQTKVMYYRPKVEEQIYYARDTYQPALLALMNDVTARTTIKSISADGKTTLFKDIQPINVDSSDGFSLSHKPSLSAEQFDAILREYNSPAVGVGSFVTSYAQSKNIDNAYALYIFIHESTAGTNKGWIGLKPDGNSSHNPGNIICAGYETCYKEFRDYATWEAGFEALIDLLAYYRDKLGDKDMRAAIYRWAPPKENDTEGYVNSLEEHVSEWRKVNKGQFTATTTEKGVFTQTKPLASFTAPPANKEQIAPVIWLEGTCLGDTIPNALEPSPALQAFSIPPHSDWSFNEHWKIINPDGHYCGIVPYGGICDMASRYHIAAKYIGMESTFSRHPGGLNGISPEDAVVIWSNGSRGGQDLVINNTSNQTAQFRAKIDNNAFVVSAWLE